MRKTGVAVAGALALTASLTMVGIAGAQEEETPTSVESAPVEDPVVDEPIVDDPIVDEPIVDDPTPDEPTPDAEPVTDEAPLEDPTAEIPEDLAPPSNPAEVLEPIELPGNVITSGTLEFNVSFADSPSSGCHGTVALSSGQMNVGYDEVGHVGGIYGLTSTGSGTLGALFLGLGAMPAGVAVLSVSDANCEFDAVAVGSWSATAATAQFGGIGFGLHPGAYDTGAYVDSLTGRATIGATGGAANLDLVQLRDFLLRERPGFPIDLTPAAETPAD